MLAKLEDADRKNPASQLIDDLPLFQVAIRREEVRASGPSKVEESLQALNPEIARAINVPPTVRGVVVTSVDASSDAAEKGIRRGDVILSVNRQPVTTPAAVLAQVEAARRANRTSVLLLLKRGSSPEAFVGVDISNR